MIENNKFFVFYDPYLDLESLKNYLKENYDKDFFNSHYVELLGLKKNSKYIDLYLFPIKKRNLKDDEISISKIENLICLNSQELTIFNSDPEYKTEEITLTYNNDSFRKYSDEDNQIKVNDFVNSLESFFEQDNYFKNNIENIIDIFQNTTKDLENKNFDSNYILNKVSSDEISISLNSNDNDIVYILIAGAFSSGKTTLINKIVSLVSNMEEENKNRCKLRTGYEETTKNIFEVSFSRKINNPIVFIDNKEVKYFDFFDTSNEKIFSNNIVKITYPLKVSKYYDLFEKIVLVDTPGNQTTTNTFQNIKLEIDNYQKKSYLIVMEYFMNESSFKIEEFLPTLNKEKKILVDIFLNRKVKDKNEIQKEYFKKVYEAKYIHLKKNNDYIYFVWDYILNFVLERTSKTEEKILIDFIKSFYYKTLSVYELHKIIDKHKKLILDLKLKVKQNTEVFESLGGDFDLTEFFGRLFNSIFNSLDLRENIMKNNFSNLFGKENSISNENIFNLKEIIILLLDNIKKDNNKEYNIFKIEKNFKFEFNLIPVIKELKIILKYDTFSNYLKKEFIEICLKLIQAKFNDYTDFIDKGSRNIEIEINKNIDLKNAINDFESKKNQHKKEKIEEENKIKKLERSIINA